MKMFFLCIVLCGLATNVCADKVTNNIISYTPPAAWKEEVKGNIYTSYTTTNELDGSYCQIFVFTGVNSKGSIAADFDYDWKNLILESYKVTQAPEVSESNTENGWQAKMGVVSFAFDNSVSMALLSTISGYNKTVSIVAITNSQEYSPAIQNLLASVEMNKQEAVEVKKPEAAEIIQSESGAAEKAKPAALQGYMEYNPYTKSYTWKLRYPPPKK